MKFVIVWVACILPLRILEDNGYNIDFIDDNILIFLSIVFLLAISCQIFWKTNEKIDEKIDDDSMTFGEIVQGIVGLAFLGVLLVALYNVINFSYIIEIVFSSISYVIFHPIVKMCVFPLFWILFLILINDSDNELDWTGISFIMSTSIFWYHSISIWFFPENVGYLPEFISQLSFMLTITLVLPITLVINVIILFHVDIYCDEYGDSSLYYILDRFIGDHDNNDNTCNDNDNIVDNSDNTCNDDTDSFGKGIAWALAAEKANKAGHNGLLAAYAAGKVYDVASGKVKMEDAKPGEVMSTLLAFEAVKAYKKNK